MLRAHGSSVRWREHEGPAVPVARRVLAGPLRAVETDFGLKALSWLRTIPPEVVARVCL